MATWIRPEVLRRSDDFRTSRTRWQERLWGRRDERLCSEDKGKYRSLLDEVHALMRRNLMPKKRCVWLIAGCTCVGLRTQPQYPRQSVRPVEAIKTKEGLEQQHRLELPVNRQRY